MGEVGVGGGEWVGIFGKDYGREDGSGVGD